MHAESSISIAIIAHNEQINVGRAVDSVLWADEVVVVDCQSTDNTKQVLKKYPKIRIIDAFNDPNLDVNKNLAIDACKSAWILSLDADEVVSNELRLEIKQILAGEIGRNGFYLMRVNHFLGRPLRYSMNYPDYVLRLFRRGKGRFPAVHVHEELLVEGEVGYLRSALLHFSYPDIESYIAKLNFYTTFEARHSNVHIKHLPRKMPLKERLRYIYWKWVPLKPILRFVVKYFVRGGFLDGLWGFHYCVLSAFSDYVVQLKKRASAAE